jgi:hypothetical protein
VASRIPPTRSLAFWSKLQPKMHIARQAKPIISLFDRPTLQFDFELENYGHFKGRALLVLHGTTECLASVGTPYTGHRDFPDHSWAAYRQTGAHHVPSSDKATIC